MSIQYHIYGNGGTGGPIDRSVPIATVSGLSWTSPALSASSQWRFAVRSFDTVTGLEESNIDVQVAVNLDSSQRDITAVPPAPHGLGVTQNVLGGYRVTWYWPYPTACTGFHIYIGTPTPDLAVPVATVPYTGLPHYHYDGTGLTSGTTYQVIVRSYNAVGEEPNSVVATVTGDSVAPANVDSLAATATSQI